MSPEAADADRLHRESFVLDLHGHGPTFLPQPVRALWRAAVRPAPPELGFGSVRAGGLDALVANAVGDPVVTRWYRHRNARQAVDIQLDQIVAQADAAGAVVATSVDDLSRARDAGRTAVLLGIEGADAVGQDVDLVDAWYQRGVRMITLVHLGDNALGTTCLPWQRYTGPLPVRRAARAGLSAVGARVVERMNERGLLVDVAHGDRATLLDVVAAAAAPVVSSHSGARALQDFPRYLSDTELAAIAGTDGLVGLWPFRHRNTGVRDVADLVAHARHIAELIGPEHLCLGTDLNGVPGTMAGYRGVPDLPRVTSALLAAGFGPPEVQGILGANALRVLSAVEERARPTP